MFGIGLMELLVICFFLFLVFGAKRIPEIAKGFGKGIADFKKALHEPSPDE